MPFYYLQNLSAHETTDCEPWMSEAVRPQLADKDAYRLWCNNPQTEHAFISAVEGKIPSLRVSEMNPPNRMSGLIVDYDSVPDAPLGPILLSKAPVNLRPAWFCRTFSGHCRVLYRFEDPVSLFTKDIAREFVLTCQREFKLKKLLAGFDEDAFVNLSQYYEIGDHWTPVGDGNAVVSSNLLLSWLAKASSKHKWEREGPVVPIDSIREECIKKFPNAWPNGWSGFEVGARGPRFWDEGASDPTAAIVRESGMQYYSDGGGYMTWEAIFGSQFIRQWADDRIGNAIKSFFYDGKNYWKRGVNGLWETQSEKDVARYLTVRGRLLKRAPKPEESSEVERAICDITELRRVKVALPFVFRPDGFVEANGDRCLNISTRRPVMPINDSVEWGEEFPKIANLLDHGFSVVLGTDGAPDPLRQRNHLLSWIQHFYLGALNQNPSRGLALFIAGPVGSGKTLLNKAILGQLMGGRQDASKYLLGDDKFNDPLFDVALWTIDDAVASGDARGLRAFSQMVKQVVANDSLVYRRMYGSGRDAEWLGRPVITMNDDPESLHILPQTDINITDKIMLLKMQRIETPGWEMSDEQIAAELPFFAAFLRDWAAPEYTRPANPRFGVVPYLHSELLESADNTNDTSRFKELVDSWRPIWFRQGGVGESDATWEGNATDLEQAIHRNENLRESLRRVSRNVKETGTHLNKMLNQHCPYLSRPTTKKYVIARPE